MAQSSPAPTTSRSIYGFVVYLLFTCLFLLYVLWAFVPSTYFELIGITELPDKYFVLFLPILILTGTTIFAFFIYPSLSFVMTTNIDSIHTIKDDSSIIRCSICNKKISVPSEDYWKSSYDCGDHKSPESTITSYCDCSEDGKNCKLSDEYLESMNKLQHKKNSASDLNIFEVNRSLYE
jgi:phosphatidylinositol N-acetylglucosaminyltransferase subunit P